MLDVPIPFVFLCAYNFSVSVLGIFGSIHSVACYVMYVSTVQSFILFPICTNYILCRAIAMYCASSENLDKFCVICTTMWGKNLGGRISAYLNVTMIRYIRLKRIIYVSCTLYGKNNLSPTLFSYLLGKTSSYCHLPKYRKIFRFVPRDRRRSRSALSSSRPWERRPDSRCKRRWWSVWRTTICRLLFSYWWPDNEHYNFVFISNKLE